jgi:hypothetical protein
VVEERSNQKIKRQKSKSKRRVHTTVCGESEILMVVQTPIFAF